MGRTLEALAQLGKGLLEAGADSRTTQSGVESIGRSCGSETDSLVSYKSVIVSIHDADEGRRTRVVDVGGMGVDMGRLVLLGRYVRRHRRQPTSVDALEEILDASHQLQPAYPRWLTTLAVGLGCAAFARLFGGSPITMLVASIAAAVGFTLRQELANRGANPNAATVLCAFTSAIVSGAACWLSIHAEPTVALTASVLYLIPGIPMVNAVEDLLHGHMAVGAGRALQAVLSTLSIAIGLLVGVAITGTPL